MITGNFLMSILNRISKNTFASCLSYLKYKHISNMFHSNYKPLTMTTPRWKAIVKNNRWQSRCMAHKRMFMDLKHVFNRWLLKFKISKSHPECTQTYKVCFSELKLLRMSTGEWGLCLKINHSLPKIWIFLRTSWETYFISSRKHRTNEHCTQYIQ